MALFPPAASDISDESSPRHMPASYAEGVAAIIERPDPAEQRASQPNLQMADLRKADLRDSELTRRSLRESLPPEPYWRVA